jgi:hypothetical protein
MKTGKYVLLFGAIIALLSPSENSIAQSLMGTSGLITIPTAAVLEDREISFGSSWLNREWLAYSNNEYHSMINFVTIGYLPFIEISLHLTRLLNHPSPRAFGDRMVGVRLRLLKESEFLPSLVLGIHDFLWSVSGYPTNSFNALYLSTSKSLRFDSPIDRIQIHLGYGTDWLDAENHQFVGLFGGISVSPRPSIAFMLEYDAERINCGLQISIFDHIELLAAISDSNALSGGMVYKFRL